jgi:hypothetical protein
VARTGLARRHGRSGRRSDVHREPDAVETELRAPATTYDDAADATSIGILTRMERFSGLE